MTGAGTEHDALLPLVELIAAGGVVEEVLEVGEEAQVGVETEDLHVLHRAVPRVPPASGETVALGASAVGAVDEPEPVDQTVLDGALGDLVGGVPLVVVTHR